MKAGKQLARAALWYSRYEAYLADVNQQLADLMAPGGDDAFITHQSGDGFVITWGGGHNTKISPTTLDELLTLPYDDALEWLEARTI
jgi:hypothetical protein